MTEKPHESVNFGIEYYSSHLGSSFFCTLRLMREYPYLAQAISEIMESMRTEKGMSKSALADFACLERRYLREIEQGEKKPTVNALYCICEALGVPPSMFFQMVDQRLESLNRTASKQSCQG